MTSRALFGVTGRRIAGQHLRTILFFMLVLLIVAFAIDITENLDEIRTASIRRDTSLGTLLFPYLGLRGVDVVTRLLPMACLVGSFTTELLRHQRLENVILQAAGASNAFLMAAILIAGLGLGTVQTVLEGWARPKAVFAQVELGLGTYARRFGGQDDRARWFLDDDRALRAQVTKSPPILRDVLLFEGVSADHLSRIIAAETATPGKDPGTWILHGVTEWRARGSGAMAAEKSGEMNLSFPLTPARVRYLGVGGFYIPQENLREITSLSGQPGQANAETAVARRWTAFLLPVVFSLLGASLARSGLSGRLLAPFRLIGLGVLGYVSLVLVKVFWALGEHGVIGPFTACLIPLAIAAALVTLLQLRLSGRFARAP
ncbi:LptF/LptG family permease [Shimia biformata]|uniref:LptF/LptG family permease n=1 Tax=Shimia biformata TaxID=1294299 RepID=UPI0023B2C58E|nr:LptF/LptG family permease [Shimia biformata]